MDIGKNLQTCREGLCVTLTELSRKTGLSLDYLTLLEQDQLDPPLSILEKIANGLKMPLGLLFCVHITEKEIEEWQNSP